jgi:hypothetical protein
LGGTIGQQSGLALYTAQNKTTGKTKIQIKKVTMMDGEHVVVMM